MDGEDGCATTRSRPGVQSSAPLRTSAPLRENTLRDGACMKTRRAPEPQRQAPAPDDVLSHAPIWSRFAPPDMLDSPSHIISRRKIMAVSLRFRALLLAAALIAPARIAAAQGAKADR